MLYVSELAALIGRNKYKPPHEAMLVLWKRLNPQNYEEACAREEADIRSDDQVVQDLSLNVHSLVNTGCEQDATRQFTQLAASQPAVQINPTTIDSVQQVLAAPHVNQAQKIEQLVKIAQPIEISASARAVLTKKAAALAAAGPAPDSQTITGFLQTVKLKDCAKLQKQVRSAVNKRRGTLNESSAIQMYEMETGSTVIENNETFYKCNVGSMSNPCWIGGRIDGLTPTKLVEVKCRRNRLFQWLPAYEKVQINAYMAMVNRDTCDLVQKFNGQIQVDTYAFDPVYWAQIVTEITDMWVHFQQIMASAKLQQKLIRQNN